MLWMTCHSSAWLRVLQNRGFVDTNWSKIVTNYDGLLIWGDINSIDISTITTLWEYSHDFPTEFTCTGCPHIDINQRTLSLSDLLLSGDIVEKLGIGLIDSSEIFGVLGPIHSSDCRGMDKGDGPVESVFTLLVNLVDIDGVIMGSYGKELLVGGINHNLAPLSRLVESCDFLWEIVVVKDGHITEVVWNSDMVPLLAVSNWTSLLMDWSWTESRGSRLDLVSLIWLSTMKVEGPYLSFSDHLLVLDAELVNDVIITTCQESTFLFNDFESPSLTIAMGCIDELLVASINIDGLDLTIVVTDCDLAI